MGCSGRSGTPKSWYSVWYSSDWRWVNTLALGDFRHRKLVTVIFWDTHGDNFNQLRNRLMPPADQGFSALLEDLAARGLLDETLVVWVGEFGRTPRINRANSGREHWPHCYSAVLAGAAVRGGSVFGASDHWAAYPASEPSSPEDLGATILHALGIDPATHVKDAVDRPLRINEGTPLAAYSADRASSRSAAGSARGIRSRLDPDHAVGNISDSLSGTAATEKR